MAFYGLEKLINLQDGYRKVFRVGSVDLLLLHEEGKTFLVKNQCPHMGKPLHGATVQAEENLNTICLRCPHHGLQFDLYSGKNINNRGNPCSGLVRYQLQYEGNVVGVEV